MRCVSGEGSQVVSSESIGLSPSPPLGSHYSVQEVHMLLVLQILSSLRQEMSLENGLLLFSQGILKFIIIVWPHSDNTANHMVDCQPNLGSSPRLSQFTTVFRESLLVPIARSYLRMPSQTPLGAGPSSAVEQQKEIKSIPFHFTVSTHKPVAWNKVKSQHFDDTIHLCKYVGVLKLVFQHQFKIQAYDPKISHG